MAEHFFNKQPQETVPFSFDFADYLPSTDTLSSAVITVFDSDGNNVTVTILSGSYSITTGKNSTNTKIVQKVTGGNDGEKFQIEILGATAEGNIPEGDIELRIKKKGYR